MSNIQKNVLGIDTSNYKTSVALVDPQGNILADCRRFLPVKQGERGLRQSDALFHHIKALPELMEDAGLADIGAVAVSTKPRPVEGSYMPVFKAGECCGRSVAAALGVPFFEFSHQEGHIEAVKHYSAFCELDEFLCYHISGGTCELLCVNGGGISIVGRSLDISFGQVLDRLGVAMGMAFPCGEEMDRLCLENSDSRADSLRKNDSRTGKLLKPIKVKDCCVNLSGLETQALRALDKIEFAENDSEAAEKRKGLIYETFDRIAEALIEMSRQAAAHTGLENILFSGGVASSGYIREKIKNAFEHSNIRAEFGKGSLSSDNAVGVALLGGKKLWR